MAKAKRMPFSDWDGLTSREGIAWAVSNVDEACLVMNQLPRPSGSVFTRDSMAGLDIFIAKMLHAVTGRDHWQVQDADPIELVFLVINEGSALRHNCDFYLFDEEWPSVRVVYEIYSGDGDPYEVGRKDGRIGDAFRNEIPALYEEACRLEKDDAEGAWLG